MPRIILLFLLVISFSFLTLIELIVLKKMGFDVAGHLKIAHQDGKKSQFMFEAFGVVAFILGQPIILTGLLVWLSKNINSEMLNSLTALIYKINF